MSPTVFRGLPAGRAPWRSSLRAPAHDAAGRVLGAFAHHRPLALRRGGRQLDLRLGEIDRALATSHGSPATITAVMTAIFAAAAAVPSLWNGGLHGRWSPCPALFSAEGSAARA